MSALVFTLGTGLAGTVIVISASMLWRKAARVAGVKRTSQLQSTNSNAPIYEKLAEEYDREARGQHSSWYGNMNTMSPVGAVRSIALMLFILGGVFLLFACLGVLKSFDGKELSTTPADTIMLQLCSPVQAKRTAPAEISPVSWHSEIISPELKKDDRLFQVSLIARSKTTKKILWETQLFSIQYNRDIEHDVQEVYLRSLTAENATIIAEDERGQVYKVDAVNGKRMP